MYVRNNNNNNNNMFLGPYTIMSQECVQQGDRLTLLFCSTIQPMLESLVSPLTLSCLDDKTVGHNPTRQARKCETNAAACRTIFL